MALFLSGLILLLPILSLIEEAIILVCRYDATSHPLALWQTIDQICSPDSLYGGRVFTALG